jgi:hypothetical protein
MNDLKTWRDEVSQNLGKILANQEATNIHLETLNGTLKDHEERIDCLEEAEHEKRGAKKFLSGLWAVIGGAIVWVFQKLFS